MVNYFTLFSIPESFQTSSSQLAATYQQLQKATHPDKFAGDSDQNKRIALQRNAQINDAYQVLKSPVRRAEHLLALRGVEIANETQTMQDMDFLMQQMEWREALADVDNATSPEDVLENLDDTVEQHKKALLDELTALLDTHTDEANHQAADAVRKLKFVNKMQAEIEAKEDQLDL